ncbi:hypothetical protein MVEN_02513200 [Mycena venus]|uniref:Zn(2)-C6 fungal-type domain-containing protein n=1 Tax=Mycena venus TaxID=2733690 RepID=A0A8H6U2L2_9AGAR|nr:hypothetical protein MVEN_02513200 [Mycena venus]
MSDSEGSSSDSPSRNLPRGMACTNCRRRKLKCDGIRPLCGQCRLRPPRSGKTCAYEVVPDGRQPSSAEMHRDIKRLKARIQQLEQLTEGRPSELPLHMPYESPSNPTAQTESTTTESETFSFEDMEEPSSDIIGSLVDTFLDRFTSSGYFFLEPLEFLHSALLPLPLGHLHRPCPSLLNTVYLWGLVLSPMLRDEHINEDTFLLAALQNLSADIRGFSIHPKFVLHTIQAELLLSLYYLHSALPIQGRYHAAAAASLAISVGLHVLGTQPSNAPNPNFALMEEVLPPPSTNIEVTERVAAFWGVTLLNNYWVAANGCPSAIPPWNDNPHAMGFWGTSLRNFDTLSGWE